ncbi:alpha/beta hydrolase fold domain-containing protein [Cellulomonas marina]|uniref:Acetyl esterase/lipase n=1 Tax=Cellulomonas marina TaxID=988821 RepID=A0A1I1AIZ9_9CELL|nr:alpha/beta hydrolase fold domain-containing protein [Cellulomonas marina]GIG30134.1 esterase [Cellulomonas marina]SFB37994.1 Acetyl esterase/lipase [Cellulomonas marina]
MTAADGQGERPTVGDLVAVREGPGAGLVVDPVLAERLPLLTGIGGRGPVSHTVDELARLEAYHAPVEGYRPPAADVQDLRVPGPHGDVPVRVYRPAGGGPATRGLVWLHGGGFGAGTLDWPEGDVVAREVGAAAGAVVVSVDYRLATANVHFPVPHDDVRAAWAWAVGEDGPGASLPWALGGASAGGNLALGVAQRLRDERGSVPAALLLAYPWLHHELPAATPDLAERLARLPDPLRITREGCRAMNAAYLGPHAPDEPYATPALGRLDRLPPTLVLLSELDDLRPSGELVADEIADAGGEVAVVVEHGAPHGHLNVAGLPTAVRSNRTMAEHLLRWTS